MSDSADYFPEIQKAQPKLLKLNFQPTLGRAGPWSGRPWSLQHRFQSHNPPCFICKQNLQPS